MAATIQLVGYVEDATPLEFHYHHRHEYIGQTRKQLADVYTNEFYRLG